MTNTPGTLPEILTNCRFYLELKLSDSPVDAYFMECKGFKRTQDVIEVCEVTHQRWGKQTMPGHVVRTKVPGNVKSNNLVLKRGMTQSMTLWNWFKAVQEGNWSDQRRNGSLSIYNQAGDVQARFEFFGAWPVSYTLTDVSASSNEVEIEELEIAFEEFVRSQ
jgi:phage tail-like protein